MATFPVLMHTVLDATDARGLAEFYRELLGLRYRPGDEPPAAEKQAEKQEAGKQGAEPDDDDWLVLVDDAGRRVLAFQRVDTLAKATWPADDVPQQLHLDFRVPAAEELERQRARAEALGATVLLDRTADEDEPLYVFADPAGHPFCVMVSQA